MSSAVPPEEAAENSKLKANKSVVTRARNDEAKMQGFGCWRKCGRGQENNVKPYIKKSNENNPIGIYIGTKTQVYQNTNPTEREM